MLASRFIADIPMSIACAAHAGTSFVPQRRGEQECQGYANTLAADYEMLSKYATTAEKQATLDAEFARYRTGYRRRTIAYLGARSRCLSSMITGPSRFPTARNAKRNASADSRCDDLIDYREAALYAIRRALCPELRPIMAGDDDAVDRLRAKIAKRNRLQQRMREANAAIRKHAKAGADAQVLALVHLDFTEEQARELLKPDFCGRIGFADYQLKNNNAQIRRLTERLGQIEVAQSTPATEIKGEHATMEDNPADNRVRLFFPGKPESDLRERLKRGGFRWAPSIGCWQAYRNHRTLDIARAVAGAAQE